MITIGFSIGHDKGAVLIVDGQVKFGISQERLSRIKHDGAWKNETTPDYDIPFASINYCLDAYDIKYTDVDLYVYNFTEDYKLASDSVEQQFSNQTGLTVDKLVYVPHHLAHACSAFYSSGFDDAAVIVVDAMGSVYNNKTMEWYKDQGYPYKNGQVAEGHSIFHFSRNSYKEVYKKWVSYPMHHTDHPEWDKGASLGYFYGTGTRQLVYNTENNTWAAGKLMGLASYADDEWLKCEPDLIDINHLTKTFKVHGWPHFYRPEVDYKSSFQDRANLAGLYQRSLERGVMMLTDYVKRNIKTDNLCVAGGCFLNCNTNEKLVKSGLFKDYFFLPPADDSGIPLGCAWFGQLTLGLGEFVPPRLKSAYFGKTYSDHDVTHGIYGYMNDTQNHNFTVRRFDSEDEQLDIVAKMLADNKVIGYFSGGSEIGPRALGHRSILASPNPVWMKEYINAEIKKREWYRPFAPSVLEDYATDIFELKFYSPFMLVTSQVNSDWISRIPAVVHIDNTSRFQSVSKNVNPKYYSLIDKFRFLTGIPLLLNTSFNGNDEPIVESPYDAIRCFYRNKLDALCIENYLITNLKK
jgi:carbamoyltransferase